VNIARIEVGRNGKHQAQGMRKRRPAQGKFSAFKSFRRNLNQVIMIRQKSNMCSEVYGDIKRAGRKVPQWIIKRSNVQRAPHINPAGCRRLNGLFFENVLEFVRHKKYVPLVLLVLLVRLVFFAETKEPIQQIEQIKPI
jgi:hypothetical protein